MRLRRHHLAPIGIFLIAGALLNVVIAWILTGAPIAAMSQEATLLTPDRDEAQRLKRRLQTPPHWPAPDAFIRTRGLGCTVTGVWGSRNGVGVWNGARIDAGWPARSMMFVRLTTPDPTLRTLAGAWPEERLSLSLDPPWALLPSNAWFTAPCDRLPLTAIPAGFVLNTLFYAAILALPLSFFPIRREFRARRGRCRTCGYDLAGLGGGCPECGAGS